MKQEIEYGDFYALDWNAIPEEMQVDFLRYLDYFIDKGIFELEERLTTQFGLKSLPKRKTDDILEGILACTPKELDTKRREKKKKNYYVCNAVCLLEVVKRIFDRNLYEALKSPSTPGIILHNYRHILKWILIDSEELCNQYANYVLGDTQYCSNINTRYIHYMPVHQVLRQALFGQVSYNSFADMEISASIAVIRQLIELRIRWAFGALAYVDKDSGGVVPLELSRLFNCIKRHKNEISFPLKIENIERIYKWANMYVHSGKCELSWIPYYVEATLRELSFGRMVENGWDVKNGISTSSEVIKMIHDELLEGHPKYEIFTCKPECVILQQPGDPQGIK